MKTRRLTLISLLTASALILHLVESWLPPLLFFAQGAKMGLANVVSLIALIVLGEGDAYFILLARIALATLFGGNVFAIAFSLPSGLCSLTLMAILYRFVFPKISLMSISFASAVTFNIVQLFVASLIAGSPYIFVMLPLMLVASTIAGLFVGFVAYYAIKALPISVYNREEQN